MIVTGAGLGAGIWEPRSLPMTPVLHVTPDQKFYLREERTGELEQKTGVPYSR